MRVHWNNVLMEYLSAIFPLSIGHSLRRRRYAILPLTEPSHLATHDILSQRQNFTLDSASAPQPRGHTCPGGTRYFALFVDSSDQASSAAALRSAVEEILEAGGVRADGGGMAWCTPTQNYHMTIYNAGTPEEPRPVTQAEEREELARVETLLQSFGPLQLELDRLLWTRTGALLAVWHVNEGNLDRLRRDLALTYSHQSNKRDHPPSPPAPILQPRTIVHTSLVRLLLPLAESAHHNHGGSAALSREQMGRLVGAAVRVSVALRGMRLTFRQLGYVRELRMYECSGEKTLIPFSKPAGRNLQSWWVALRASPCLRLWVGLLSALAGGTALVLLALRQPISRFISWLKRQDVIVSLGMARLVQWLRKLLTVPSWLALAAVRQQQEVQQQVTPIGL
ncbi:unnamed protein product [Vitrella brassicaformis CCMP3155]|uniref:Uncharacterized protein n=1 Tax=Vitrella brassicaformis (strain CCMP3155) TaxID=1169540 RepID=A0A0G4E9U2_VITBC|nr:unnamed protein product [Vitrella brassicaformis CCMP3155]|eukprot:CEL92422.1 unnamed protein product [Vitrella brassicaformis CCMP3155]